MVLCDYFSAPGDNTAVRVLDDPAGPDPSVIDVEQLKGIDPVIELAHLEAILTGRTYDEVSERPRVGQLVSSPDAEAESFIVSVSDDLQQALASATHSCLVEAAGPWSRTEELRLNGITDETALDVLVLLAGLARRSRSAGLRLYCWWSL